MKNLQIHRESKGRRCVPKFKNHMPKNYFKNFIAATLNYVIEKNGDTFAMHLGRVVNSYHALKSESFDI